MPPRPFYSIPPDAVLFGRSLEKPEESVRQWVLFELLSTYGIVINSIQIERPVKVGSKNIYADIVILREGAPYVVIECKNRDEKKHPHGMDQALSYADANSMKAQYAVYTNGDVWQVKRKFGNTWVDIPDLPKNVDGEYRIKLDELLSSLNDFKPAFYWFNKSIPSASANTYFACLQELFNGSTYPLNFLDNHLLSGTDNLLRVILTKGDDPIRLQEKMIVACKSYSAFLDNRIGKGLEDEFMISGNLWELAAIIQFRFERLVEDTRGLHSDEVLCIRFITTLIHYLKDQIHVKKKSVFFQDVPVVLSGAFESLVGFLFQVHLGINFPDPVLAQSNADLRRLCEDSWKQFKVDRAAL